MSESDSDQDKARKMSTKDRLVETTAGALFFGALVLLGLYTIVLSSSALFGAKDEMYISFTNTQGLAEGDKILLRGMQIGKVKSVSLDPDQQRVIILAVLTDEFTFYKNYVCEVRSTSMLGGKHIYMERGDAEGGVFVKSADTSAEDPLIGQDTVDVFKKLETAANSIQNFFGDFENDEESSLSKIMKDEGELYASINDAFKSIGETGGDIEKRLDITLTKADETLDNMNGAISDARDGKGTVGKLMTDDALYEDAKQLMADLQEAAERLNSPDSTLAKLSNDDGALYTSVKDSFDNINGAVTDARDGKGSLGKFMTDEQLYNDATALMADLQKTAERLNNPDSTLSKISNDDGALYDSVKGSFDNMSETMATARELAEKIKQGEGTLGKLINDPTLYDEAALTIQEVQGAVSDFREQAPVMTFGSLIFGSL